MFDEEIIENGFWVSDKNQKEGIGVVIFPGYTEQEEGGQRVCTKLDTINFRVVWMHKGNSIADEVAIHRSEFKKLFEFMDALKEELGYSFVSGSELPEVAIRAIRAREDDRQQKIEEEKR